jgi:hypothetical protein
LTAIVVIETIAVRLGEKARISGSLHRDSSLVVKNLTELSFS